MTKIINGFPNYSIHRDGTITNTKTKTTKQPWLGANGYLHVDLYHENKSSKISIHRLLALHFIPNPDNKRTVNHIDGNKTNNDLSNLEWATDSQNMQHAYDNNLNRATNKKISNEAMDEILIRFYNGETLTAIISDYPFSLPTLSTYLEDYVIFKDELDKFNSEKVRQKLIRAKSAKHIQFAVIGTNLLDPTDVRTFSSLSEATRTLGKTSSGPISNCISGKQKSAYGFTWIRS